MAVTAKYVAYTHASHPVNTPKGYYNFTSLPLEPSEPQNPDEGEDLSENDTPLADVPQTGDFLWVWLALALLSTAGLVWVSPTEKKGKRVA